MSIRQALTALGVAGPLAAEIQAQIEAEVGNAQRLIGGGMVPASARVLADGISAGSVSGPKLAATSVPTVLALYLAGVVGA